MMVERVATLQKVGVIQREIGWARVFLGYLREAEGPQDQIRLRGMGVCWTAETPVEGNVLEYLRKMGIRSDALGK